LDLVVASVPGIYIHQDINRKEDGDVKKVKSSFDLEKFKLSYVGELSLGRFAFMAVWL
jgi:hypothetical protein